MRAAIYGGVGKILVERVPDPVMLEDDDVIVRVTAASICGTDVRLYWGTMNRMIPVEPGDPLGHEFVGVIEEVGRATVPRVGVGPIERDLHGSLRSTLHIALVEAAAAPRVVRLPRRHGVDEGHLCSRCVVAHRDRHVALIAGRRHEFQQVCARQPVGAHRDDGRLPPVRRHRAESLHRVAPLLRLAAIERDALEVLAQARQAAVVAKLRVLVVRVHRVAVRVEQDGLAAVCVVLFFVFVSVVFLVHIFVLFLWTSLCFFLCLVLCFLFFLFWIKPCHHIIFFMF